MHKIATEVTLILEGSAEMSGQRLDAGDILVLEPGEASDFRALTDVVTVVVKLPSVAGDKYRQQVGHFLGRAAASDPV